MLGRPKAKIDWKKVANLCKAGCCGVEIAANIGINENTLYERCEIDNQMLFSEFLRLNKANGNSLLRGVQFKKAMSGDNTMLVWLGKNRLGQTDKASIESTNSNINANVNIETENINDTEEIFRILKESLREIPTTEDTD